VDVLKKRQVFFIVFKVNFVIVLGGFFAEYIYDVFKIFFRLQPIVLRLQFILVLQRRDLAY
jgi:hypothetical protein